MGVYIPNRSTSDWQSAFGGFAVPPEWFNDSATIYRPSNADDEAGGRVVGDISTWTVLFQNVPVLLTLDSVEEANPEGEPHQVIEEMVHYKFWTDCVKVFENGIQVSDIIGLGPKGSPTRIFNVKSWQKWPEINPTFGIISAQEVRQ